MSTTTGRLRSGPPHRRLARPLAYTLGMLAAPAQTTRALLNDRSLGPAFTLVVGFGVAGAAGFLWSHLVGDYPRRPPNCRHGSTRGARG